MKKLILLITLFLSLIGYAQNPSRIKEGVDVPFVQLDTLSTVERDALTVPTGNTRFIYHKDTGVNRLEWWNGTSWQPVDTSGSGTNPTTTKGDVSTHDGTNPERLPVGTNGQILSANSATTTGLEWIDNSGGGASQLSDLSDVNTSTPTNRNVLVADGVDFESRPLVEADISDLQAYITSEVNDLSSAVTWVNVPDANITQSSVTQHQGSLSITESQISDLTHTTDTNLTQEEVEDYAFDPLRFGNGLRTLIAVTYDDANNEVDFVVNDDLSLYDNTTSNFSTGAHTVNTDNQTLSFTSPNLSISGGNSVDISAIDTDTQLEIASSVEVNTGTNNTKAISPLALAGSQLQTDVTANNSKVTESTTVSDTAEIDLTLSTYNISGSIVAGSIDETKLDASTNASLDLADSALQGNETITLSGDVSGSGATAISSTVQGLRGVSLDATVGSPTDGKIMVYRSAGSDWVLEDKPVPGGGGATQLNELSDVTNVTYTNRHVLIADGTDYDSRALVEADISDLQSYLTTEVDGSVTNELQTLSNTSDATSHTVTLSNSGGSVQLVEGSNITLTTTGTGSDGIVTIAAAGGGATNITVVEGATSVDIQSSTGTNDVIELANGTTAGVSENNLTDAEKTILGNTSGTNTGDQTSIVGITGTKAQFDTAVTDGDFLYVGDVTDTDDQTASEVNTTTTNFDGNLSGADTTVQLALETLDNLTIEDFENKNLVNSLADFDALISGSTPGLWIINADITLDANKTLPSGVALIFNDSQINLNTYTLTGTDTVLLSAPTQIFDTTGTFAGTWDIEEMYPQWFGAKGDGVTDDTAAIQKALDSYSLTFTTRLIAGTYLVSSPLKVYARETLIGSNSPTVSNCSIIRADITSAWTQYRGVVETENYSDTGGAADYWHSGKIEGIQIDSQDKDSANNPDYGLIIFGAGEASELNSVSVRLGKVASLFIAGYSAVMQVYNSTVWDSQGYGVYLSDHADPTYPTTGVANKTQNGGSVRFYGISGDNHPNGFIYADGTQIVELSGLKSEHNNPVVTIDGSATDNSRQRWNITGFRAEHGTTDPDRPFVLIQGTAKPQVFIGAGTCFNNTELIEDTVTGKDILSSVEGEMTFYDPYQSSNIITRSLELPAQIHQKGNQNDSFSYHRQTAQFDNDASNYAFETRVNFAGTDTYQLIGDANNNRYPFLEIHNYNGNGGVDFLGWDGVSTTTPLIQFDGSKNVTIAPNVGDGGLNVANGGITTTDIEATGSYTGNGQTIVTTADEWLRLNPSGHFTNGIFGGASIFRTDGGLQVGSGGANFNVAGSGAVTATSFNGVALTTGGSATNFLNEQGNYVAAGGGSVSFGTDNQIPVMNVGGTDFEYSSGLVFETDKLGVNLSGSAGKTLDVNGDMRIRGDLGTLNFYRTTSPTDIAYIQYDNTAGELILAANNKSIVFNNGSGFVETLKIDNEGKAGFNIDAATIGTMLGAKSNNDGRYAGLFRANSATQTQDVFSVQNHDGTTEFLTVGNTGATVLSSTIAASNLSGTNTGDQTITLTGDVTGSGTGSFAATVTDDSHNHIISNIDNLQTELDKHDIESKSITIESPTATEDITLFFTDRAITITQLNAVNLGTTPSVTYTIRHNSDRSATGNEVVTGGSTTTSTTTGNEVTSFNDATIPADSWVWLETTAKSGIADLLNVTLKYTID